MNIINRQVMLRVSLLAMVGLLAACANDFWGKYYPERFGTIQEAYPPGEADNVSSIPEDAYVRRKFDVAYADLFEIVDKSASQIGIDLQETDKQHGILFGKKVVYWYDGHGKRRPVHLFTKIMVKEQGPRRSTVTLVVKSQGDCLESVWGSCKDLAIKPTYNVGPDTIWHKDIADIQSVFMVALTNNLNQSGLR